MDLGLKNKVAGVTGSSRGIGRAIAHKLAEEGCHVSLCARTIGPLEACEAEIREKGVKVLCSAVSRSATRPFLAAYQLVDTFSKHFVDHPRAPLVSPRRMLSTSAERLLAVLRCTDSAPLSSFSVTASTLPPHATICLKGGSPFLGSSISRQLWQ